MRSLNAALELVHPGLVVEMQHQTQMLRIHQLLDS
jgi:hypothetical protein